MRHLLVRLSKILRPRVRWWDFSYERLWALPRQAVMTLELEALSVTPPSFRHGGASHGRLVAERSLLDIQRRGMWKSFSSARRHEKSGRIGLQLHKMTPLQMRRCRCSRRTC